MSKPTLQNNLKIKRHEDNIKFLQTEIKRLSQSILNVQVSLANHHSGNGNGATDENGATRMEEEETEQIMRHERSAAALLCKLKPMKSHHATQALNLTLTQDVLGIVGVVASLGRVDSDDLSRPYVGGFVADNPQRKLALPKPQFPNGECPHGFLDYAVNMINLDKRNLLSLTTAGHGLRETLFYSLFSRLQVYKTRREMLLALPCINDGALSLDGGMIKPSGVFALGSRKNIEVKFLAASGESSMLANYIETEELLKKLKLERTYVTEDMQREQELLDLAKKDLSMIL